MFMQETQRGQCVSHCLPWHACREVVWYACNVCWFLTHPLPTAIALAVQVAAGASKLPGGRSWQLIDCAPVDGSGPGGVKALQALKQHLSDVLEVMLPAFGEQGDVKTWGVA